MRGHPLQLVLVAGVVAGCQDPAPVIPPSSVPDLLSDSERDALTPEERQLYDAAVSGKLVGAPAADYQIALQMADETFSKSTSPTVTHYAFELVPAKACEEGPPQMAISVLDGKIVGCYIGCPEF